MATVIKATILRIGITPDATTPGLMIPPPMYPSGPGSGTYAGAVPFEDIVYLTLMLTWPYTGNWQVGIAKDEVSNYLVGGSVDLTVSPGNPDEAQPARVAAGRTFSVGLAPTRPPQSAADTIAAAAPPTADAPTSAQTPVAQDPAGAPQVATPAQLGASSGSVQTAQ